MLTAVVPPPRYREARSPPLLYPPAATRQPKLKWPIGSRIFLRCCAELYCTVGGAVHTLLACAATTLDTMGLPAYLP